VSTVKEIILAHDGYVTATVNAYTHRLQDIVGIATARTVSELHRKLTILPDGTIANTPGNTRVLKGIAAIFQDEMDAAGFQGLNKAYAGQFSGQLPFLDQLVDKVGESLSHTFPDVKDALDAQDRKALAALQSSTVANLETVVDTAAAAATRQALFNVAGLSASDLAATLAKAFGATVPHAEAIADTAQVAWYRTASDRTYRAIESDLPGFKIEYEYDGPLDSLNRRVCKLWRQQSIAGKRWTREDIDKLDNGAGQPKPVMIFCGGIRCRHQWIVSV